jgi:hypothetical protein
MSGCRNSALSLATVYGLDGRGIGFRVLVEAQDFSSLHVVQTDSGVHPAHYPVGTWGKAAGPWSWSLASN